MGKSTFPHRMGDPYNNMLQDDIHQLTLHEKQMLNEILNKRNNSKISKRRSHCNVTMAQRDENRHPLAPQSD